jgi:hypothetical protein
MKLMIFISAPQSGQSSGSTLPIRPQHFYRNDSEGKPGTLPGASSLLPLQRSHGRQAFMTHLLL